MATHDLKAGRNGRHGLLRASTRAFLDEARRTPGFSALDLLHGYVYLHGAYTYIAIGLGEHWINRWIQPFARLFDSFSTPGPRPDGRKLRLSEVYHGKVLRTEAARQLVSVNEDVAFHDLESIVPYRFARDIVLQDPEHIVVIDCPCRSSRLRPCLPLDVCLVVGEPFASFIADHHPDKARWIDADGACNILEREHDRGRVHQAFFKDATLGRFYVICNCCSCCCGAMQARRNGVPLLAASGYSSRVKPQRCVGCGDCVDRCPFGAIELRHGVASVVQQACMGCGVCLRACEANAFSLERDPSRGLPLEIAALIEAEHAKR